nr:hypothetical protein [uncultured Flavobacterium sp.]
MSYLICINEKTGEILHPEVVKLVDSFSLLSREEMLYVALYTDYNSIYKQFPEHERSRRAMWHAFNENMSDVIASDRIQIAIKEYTSLQFDPDIELINRFQTKIDRLLDILDKEDSPSMIEKTTKAINSLRENIVSLRDKVDERTKQDGVIKGERQLSFLERLQQNKKRYLAAVQKR